MYLIEVRDAYRGPPPGLSVIDLLWTDPPIGTTPEQIEALHELWPARTVIMLGPAVISERSRAQIADDIAVHTAPGDLVADPFCGTGMTGLVASDCGRSFYGADTDQEMARRALARIRTGVDPG